MSKRSLLENDRYGDEVQALEALIKAGDAGAMKAYVRNALRFHLDDRDELHHRRLLLGRLDTDFSTQIECFGLLSAAMGDRKSWDLSVRTLGEDCDPGFGYLTWHLILYHSKDETRAETWMDAVRHSARRGHFPSGRQGASLE